MSNKYGSIPIEQIRQIIKKYENQLSGLLRYARFMEKETAADWVKLLGPDVVGLTHPDVTVGITEEFIRENTASSLNLTPREQTLLITAAWVHDWGEMIIDGQGIGDVTYEQKNRTHEDEEIRIFDLLLVDIKNQQIAEYLKKSYLEVAFDRKSRLGKMFNAIERIGYLATGIRAYQGVSGQRIANWRGLVGNVLSNQIATLLEYRTAYPAVNVFLNRHEALIGKMLDDVLAEDVPLDNTGSVSYDQAKLLKARELWLNRVK